MGKLRRARSVWIPYSAAAGTGSSPRGSRSTRVALIASVRSVTTPSVANQESPMATQDLMLHVPARATFSPANMTNLVCLRPERLLVGLNSFDPDHVHPVHAPYRAAQFHFLLS